MEKFDIDLDDKSYVFQVIKNNGKLAYHTVIDGNEVIFESCKAGLKVVPGNCNDLILLQDLAKAIHSAIR